MTIGHNVTGGIAGDRLRSFIERIEKLEDERKGLGDDIKEVYSEIKGAGLDVKTIRRLVRDRRKDPDDLEEEQVLLEIYRKALGEFASSPLGVAALASVGG